VELVPTLRAAPAAALHHIVDRPGKESMATGVRSGSKLGCQALCTALVREASGSGHLETGGQCRRNANCRLVTSNLATIVGPVQQSLALTRAAHWIAWLAMPSNLRDVSSDRRPAFDLARIFGRHAAAHVVPTIPLEPAAWVVGMNPALVAPDRQGLASIDAKIVKRWVGTGCREPRAHKPARGKFVAAISHVLSAEDAEGKHLFRRQLGAKFRVEIAPRRRGEAVSVAALHLVVDGYDFHPFGHCKDLVARLAQNGIRSEWHSVATISYSPRMSVQGPACVETR
jgi:hypothetical protein